jgi:hypothetical protein
LLGRIGPYFSRVVIFRHVSKDSNHACHHVFTAVCGGLMYKTQIKLLLSSIAIAALAACGGGGDEASPSSPTVDLSILAGSDRILGTFTNSCTGTGAQGANVVIKVSGDTITMTASGSGESIDYTLKYSSGDNNNGFVFSGSVRNSSTGATATVQSATLRNTGTPGNLNLLANITAAEGNCKVTQLLKHW